MIQVIKSFDEIDNLNKVIELIGKQMKHIGSDSNSNKIELALENALASGKRSVLFLCKSDEGDYQGFAFANIACGLESGGDNIWINELYVDELFRRQNLASYILTFIEDWCQKNQIKYIACCTGTSNEKAQALYKKNGYSIEDIAWVDKSID